MNPHSDNFIRNLELIRSVVAFTGLMLLLTWESFAPFFAYTAGRQRGTHVFRNLVVGVINALLVGFVFASLWFAVSQWAERNQFGVLNYLKVPIVFHFPGALLLLDCWMYWWHRINHRIPFFWRFHRMHHSDVHMDVTTASRFHLGEIFFSSCLRIPLIALLGIRFWELIVYETIMFLVVQLHHANVGLPRRVDNLLRLLIVTPAMHKVHHSRWRIETDSNYSSLFSFWDRLFRSFRLRKDSHTIHFGLDEFDLAEDQTLSGLMKTPLAERAPKNLERK
ncbi:sterol desaturase family protein [Pedosphaera parvula]|uniref:Fatty acid hydroxylase n=1 Tax=Pedosphaera parvula (strain Ellin514) TaxID=320771 RepID=B9XC23_PEDPL|nr:sterol desaturase family protein [Pedosphaera parvula]EEF62491.1 fatty acid hydroxylase [Pedosphaera parvula Ellin514]